MYFICLITSLMIYMFNKFNKYTYCTWMNSLLYVFSPFAAWIFPLKSGPLIKCTKAASSWFFFFFYSALFSCRRQSLLLFSYRIEFWKMSAVYGTVMLFSDNDRFEVCQISNRSVFLNNIYVVFSSAHSKYTFKLQNRGITIL